MHRNVLFGVIKRKIRICIYICYICKNKLLKDVQEPNICVKGEAGEGIFSLHIFLLLFLIFEAYKCI